MAKRVFIFGAYPGLAREDVFLKINMFARAFVAWKHGAARSALDPEGGQGL